MTIDLGIIGDFVTLNKFWGGLAIGLPLLTIGLFVLYSLVKKIPFLKKMVQYILMTFGFSIILLIPLVFFSAFLETEKLKIALTYLVILFFVAVFMLFNQTEVVSFLKDISKLKNKNTLKQK
jgi:DNA integrity scanning protein DisA with diadenylate cyclase activity